MVTSVNGNSLAALQARENTLANRPTGAQTAAGDDAALGRDPAVIYAGSNDPSGLSAILSVQDSLNRAASIADVGANAGSAIADLLKLAREKAQAAQSAGADKAGLNADYQQLLQTIDQIATSASFQGVKILDGSGAGDLQFKADVNGEATISLTPQDFTTGGPSIGLAGTDLLGSSDDLAALLGQVDAAAGAVDGQLAQLKGKSDQIQTHLGVIGQLQNALGGPNPVDLDADSARLQALQIQQALTGQGGGLVNQAPQTLLALFRS